MKIVKLLLPLVIGIAIGFFANKFCCNGYCSIDGGGDEVANFTPINDVADAHRNSARFRNNLHYCNVDTNGNVLVPANQLGFLDLNSQNLKDLNSVAKDIKSKLGADPIQYRIINGVAINGGDTSSIYMVVPLDTKGNEITKNSSSQSLIYKLDNIEDCPKKCDYGTSAIIGDNPCQ